jgi:subunit NDUFA12 isoform CRA_a
MGLKERGLRGVLKQLSAMGEIKLGTLKGQDEHGNMYYEGLNYQFGEPF